MSDVDLEALAARSRRRVWDRLEAAAPCRGDEPGTVRCPFCDRPLSVRRSILGRLAELPDGRRPHIEGVEMKCAGDAGCAFRPDFDVPLSEEKWQREYERRGERRLVDVGYEPAGDDLQERLRALGYLPEC